MGPHENTRQKKGERAYSKVGRDILVGHDWGRTAEIERDRLKTMSRSCYRQCRTCGTCSASKRDATYPKSYDEFAGRWVDCRGCEPNRFHDCENGFMRDSRGDAEPFTEEVTKVLNMERNARPLI